LYLFISFLLSINLVNKVDYKWRYINTLPFLSFLTIDVGNKWSKNVDKRWHCHLVTPRGGESFRPTLTPSNTWFHLNVS